MLGRVPQWIQEGDGTRRPDAMRCRKDSEGGPSAELRTRSGIEKQVLRLRWSRAPNFAQDDNLNFSLQRRQRGRFGLTSRRSAGAGGGPVALRSLSQVQMAHGGGLVGRR